MRRCISEGWNAKDLKGSGSVLILRNYPVICLERLRKTTITSGYPACGPRFDPENSRIRSRRVNHWTTIIGIVNLVMSVRITLKHWIFLSFPQNGICCMEMVCDYLDRIIAKGSIHLISELKKCGRKRSYFISRSYADVCLWGRTGSHGVRTQRCNIDIFTAVRTSNPVRHVEWRKKVQTHQILTPEAWTVRHGDHEASVHIPET
jgi:hypothetical protein